MRRSHFTKPARMIAALLTGLLFAVLTGCSSTAVTPLPPVLAATSGSGQSATVGAAFAASLVTTATTNNGTPVSGLSVTFTAPAESGSPNTVATCTFAGGGTTETDTTASNGTASSSPCTTTTVSGAYTVAVTAFPALGAAFSLTNVSGPPAAIAATSGTPQTATVSTAFTDPLVATVTDSDGNPVSGASVTFKAPSSGASGAFANGTNTETDTTDANGDATSSTFTANATSGGYTVTATVTGVATPADFSLTNH